MLESLSHYYIPQGHGIIKHTSSLRAYSNAVSVSSIYRHSFRVPNQRVCVKSHSENLRNKNCTVDLEIFVKGSASRFSSKFYLKKLPVSNHRVSSRRSYRLHATLEVAAAVDVINDLGMDTLTFLAVTVLVVPALKIIRASPILGFFFAGVVLNQFGLIRNLTDVKVLSEWGILFLLFEMGLELSLARLKALAKFAFGMGLTQVLLSTLAFTAFELPPNGAIGTRILEFLFHSRPDLVNIRSIDEAIVIGAALSLSSSAFVLQEEICA